MKDPEKCVKLLALLEEAEIGKRWEISYEVAALVPHLPSAKQVIGYADAEIGEVDEIVPALAARVSGLAEAALARVRKEKTVYSLAAYLAALREDCVCPDWVLNQKWPCALHRHLLSLIAAVSYQTNQLPRWLASLEGHKTRLKKSVLRMAVLTALVYRKDEVSPFIFSDWWEIPKGMKIDCIRLHLAKDVTFDILLRATVQPNASFHISQDLTSCLPGRSPSSLVAYAPTLNPKYFDHNTLQLRLEAIERCRVVATRLRFPSSKKRKPDLSDHAELIMLLEQLTALTPGATKAERSLILDTFTSASTLLERSLRHTAPSSSFIKFQADQLLTLTAGGRQPLSPLPILERLRSISRILQYEDTGFLLDTLQEVQSTLPKDTSASPLYLTEEFKRTLRTFHRQEASTGFAREEKKRRRTI